MACRRPEGPISLKNRTLSRRGTRRLSAARHTHIPYSTTHANQVRSAASHCSVPTAASRQWALQLRRSAADTLAAARCTWPLQPMCAPGHRPLCSLRPLNIRQTRRARERVGAVFEVEQQYLRGRSRRTQRTAADRPTAAQGPASGCSIEVLAAILYGDCDPCKMTYSRSTL